MPQQLSTEEIISEVESFLNEQGLYNDFIDYITGKGYTAEEFGLTEE